MSALTDLLTRLAPLGTLEDRPHLGGWELRSGGRRFGVLMGTTLWLCTSPNTRDEYRRRGSMPFTPNPQMELGDFYEVPIEVMAEEDALVSWARKALNP